MNKLREDLREIASYLKYNIESPTHRYPELKGMDKVNLLIELVLDITDSEKYVLVPKERLEKMITMSESEQLGLHYVESCLHLFMKSAIPTNIPKEYFEAIKKEMKWIQLRELIFHLEREDL